ncbi:MAG: 4-hydroxy-tetrahydrodipicolinate reductase [Caulobacterales bacterium]
MTGSAPLRIGISGALGRMGQAVAKLLEETQGAEVTAAFDQPGTQGQTAGERVLGVMEDAANCDVVVDFSTGEASAALAAFAAARGGPALVIGATVWTPRADAQVREAAQKIAIVRSGSFSLGVNIMAGLVEETARRLGARDWDIEVLEAHHHRKVDAPSGTALLLGEAAARGRGVELAKVSARARDGVTGARREGDIGFAVLRGGGLVGEHSVMFAAEDEILTLSHSARDRSLFARGAVQAALWLRARPPGLYDMMDVLGFRSPP